MDRRDFFIALGRYSLLAGLAAIGAAALWRNASSRNTACPQDLLCGTCGELQQCQLDKAQLYRELARLNPTAPPRP